MKTGFYRIINSLNLSFRKRRKKHHSAPETTRPKQSPTSSEYENKRHSRSWVNAIATPRTTRARSIGNLFSLKRKSMDLPSRSLPDGILFNSVSEHEVHNRSQRSSTHSVRSTDEPESLTNGQQPLFTKRASFKLRNESPRDENEDYDSLIDGAYLNDKPKEQRPLQNTDETKTPAKKPQLTKNFSQLFMSYKKENLPQLIHLAAASGDVKKLKHIIKNRKIYPGDLINVVDHVDGSTPLHKAASKNHAEAIQVLLDAGAKIGAKDQLCSTPLHWAAANGGDEAVQTLCSAGAEINIRDKFGYGPLHLALRKQFYKTAEILLLYGGDINFKKSDASTCLHLACEAGDLRTVKWLLKRSSKLLNSKDKAGLTPIIRATIKGKVKVVEYLMKNNLVSYSVTDDKGQNILHKACFYGHKEIVYKLASIDPIQCVQMLTERDSRGRTPLHLAVRENHFALIKSLCGMMGQTNLDIQDNRGNTPLHYAIEKGHHRIARYLQISGAKSTIKNKGGETPRMLSKRLANSSKDII